MAKSIAMFLQQPDCSHPVFEKEPRRRVIANKNDEDSQCDESSSCYSSEPQLLDDDDDNCSLVSENHHRLGEEENDCEMVVRPQSPYAMSVNVNTCEPSSTTRTSKKSPSQSNFCWLPPGLHPKEFRDDEQPYKGIPSNPPAVCSEGINRGNFSLLHRKAWLEVSDPKHRYGKHLRFYHRHWETLTHMEDVGRCWDSSSDFFDWLDSQGAFVGQPLPELADCPRHQLDSDTVHYIDDAMESQRYAVQVLVDNNGRRGQLVCAASGMPIRTGSSGWMFVLRDNNLYAAPKITTRTDGTSGPQRFHHSSFFGGRAVQAAGIFVTCDRTSSLTQILPHSGHYRPGESDVQRILYYLSHKGICWTTFQVDVQQFLHIDRSKKMHRMMESSGDVCGTIGKMKKVESLHLCSAVTVADYLSHKARFMQNGVFAEIEGRRV
jgi:hypothetical protein